MNKDLLQQLFSIPLEDGRYLVYAPLKRIAFVANSALVNQIYQAIDNLQDYHPMENYQFFQLLAEEGFWDAAPEPEETFTGSEPDYDTVILFLTNQCNLRCNYCYANSGEYPAKRMEWETAKASIDRVWNNVTEKKMPSLTLGFHGGGEPTMNWDILTRSVDYIYEIKGQSTLELHIAGAFNGCWTPEQGEYIIKKFTEASISLDGLPAIQNRQRPAAGGATSYERVSANLLELDCARFQYGIRMTVTKDALPYMYDSIIDICKKFRPQKIQVEPVFNQGRAANAESLAEDYMSFSDQFMSAREMAVKYNIELFYSGARLNLLSRRFCLAPCRALVVTADGDITTCFESYGREHPLSRHFLIGNINPSGALNIDKERMLDFYKYTVDDNPHCSDCFCRWHCAGDCAIKAMTENNGEACRSSDRCQLNQELTKRLLLQKIKDNGAMIWLGNKH